MPLWNEIEGRSLDGMTLRKLMRSEGRTAWFATENAAGEPAVLSVFEALNDEDAVQARLQAAARVEHPALLAIRGIGAGRLDDESLVYAVLEPYDQTLAEVLRERTLAPEEAREVSDSLLSALEAVESAGLRHGHVDASGVLGVGDNIKLRSDCLTGRHSGESDAPALAALIYNALTGRRYSSERDALQLPAPFATLVRAGAGSNGSLAAMRRVLNPPAAPVTAADTGTPLPAAVHPAAPPNRVAATGRGNEERGSGTLEFAERKVERRRRPGVTIAALVIMAIVLAVFWYAFKRPIGHTPITGEAPSSAPSTPATPAATPAPQAVPSRAEPAKPAAKPTLSPPVPAKADAAAPAGDERSVWHVIAYTYNRETAAQRKAAELTEKYPQLEPQVFSPRDGAPYLISLGSGMDRQQAFARRDAARKAGLPSDTYAQNFRK